jgi:hypothetical protein
MDIRYERSALKCGMAIANQGKSKLRFGGVELQKLYESSVKPSETPIDRADFYTCAYCGKTGMAKLLQCSCTKVSYCGRDCQIAAWPCHKRMECVKNCYPGKETKKLCLTWDQVEAYAGQPSSGKLVVRFIGLDNYGRYVCRDRVGKFRPKVFDVGVELVTGDTITWKYPRHVSLVEKGFSGGAHITKEDMKDVVVDGGYKLLEKNIEFDLELIVERKI